MRVGYLDMTDSSHQCPSGFTEHRDSNIRTCQRNDTSAGCGSVMIDVPYHCTAKTIVCISYQKYAPCNTQSMKSIL